mgnify:CR=1 FL=1
MLVIYFSIKLYWGRNLKCKRFSRFKVCPQVIYKEQWKDRTGKTNFRIVDATTGKLQESVL